MENSEQSPLTPQQLHFCSQYINTGNAKEAAILANYKTNPEQRGIALLSDERIAQKIERLYEEKKKNLMYKACVGYERLAFGSIADAIKLLFIEDVNLGTLNEMDLFNIAEIKKKDNAVEIKFFDRLKALEKLEQSDAAQKNDANPFYFALEQGMKALHSDKEITKEG